MIPYLLCFYFTGTVLPPKPSPDTSSRAQPIIRRGMIAWAGGGGGSDAFIALAHHPEWGHGHTVWGEVLAEDMAVVDRWMLRAIKTENWWVGGRCLVYILPKVKSVTFTLFMTLVDM